MFFLIHGLFGAHDKSLLLSLRVRLVKSVLLFSARLFAPMRGQKEGKGKGKGKEKSL